MFLCQIDILISDIVFNDVTKIVVYVFCSLDVVLIDLLREYTCNQFWTLDFV